MPVPPPPPAPPPPSGPPAPPPPPFSQGRTAQPKLKQETGGGGGRSALLSDIHKGARLKKVTQINDRSAPVIESAKKNGGTGNGRSAMAPPAGGLFAGGFPVLKPSGQRDVTGNKSAPQLPVMKGSVPKQDQVPTKIDLSKPVPHTVAARAPPPRPTILGHSPPMPPPIPPSSSKPQLMPSSPVPPPFIERSTKPTVGSSASPSPLNSQDKTKLQRPLSNLFPSTPPPLPLHPPPGHLGRRSPSPSLPDVRDQPGFPAPPLPSVHSRVEDYIPPPPDIRDLPPPPPPSLHPMSMSAKRRLSEPLPPPPVFVSEHSNVPPRPPKGLPARPSIPPVPGHGRPHKPAVNSGGRLAPPPPPPARSPSTELSSRQQGNQQPPNRNLAQHGYRPPSPGNVHPLDDFESKFTFHSVEDLPPPEVYEPFERIYPSKCHLAPSGPPPQRPQMR